jgi:hypothetical protein
MHEEVTDLGNGQQLPIWCSASDYNLNSPGLGWECNGGEVINELHLCVIAYPECW